MSSYLLKSKGISLTLHKNTILHDISLTVSEGEIVTVVGPNGAGKTMLLRVLLGLQKPTQGQVWLRPQLRIGYMPQKLKIEPTLPLTVKRFLCINKNYDNESLQSVLNEVGATSLSDHSFHVLSGGEVQRVLLARALLNKPQLLVLDEPVQGVDINGQRSLYQLIAHLRERWKCGVLLVSHDLNFVFAASDKVICLNQHICCAGKPEKVAKDPQYTQIFGESGIEHLALYTHHHDHHHDQAPDELNNE